MNRYNACYRIKPHRTAHKTRQTMREVFAWGMALNKNPRKPTSFSDWKYEREMAHAVRGKQRRWTVGWLRAVTGNNFIFNGTYKGAENE